MKTAALLMALGLALPAMTLAQDGGGDRPPRRDGPPPRELNREGGPRDERRGDGPRSDARPRDGARAEGQREGGPRGPGERPNMPPPPLVGALDVNHDGVIDEQEIKDAPKSLRKLDKNNDGKLTLDELRPPRPEGDRADARPRGPREDGERHDVRPRDGERDRGPADRPGGNRDVRRDSRPPEGR